MQPSRTVYCDKCGSGLEVEQILVGPNGTPIKCGTCAHVFSVFPKDKAKLQSPVVWMVRDPSGNITPFSKLGVLQRVIMNQQATTDWELSRFGEAWQKLGDIDGLKMFFGPGSD